jgi:hypothetical protein
MAAVLSLTLLLAASAFAQGFVPTPVRRQAEETTSPLPLTDYHYTYPNLPEQVKSVLLLLLLTVSALIRPLTVLFLLVVDPNPATIFVTALRKARTLYVRPCSSTTSVVRFLFVLFTIEVNFDHRLLYLGLPGCGWSNW